jgi:hypothetical protein
MINTPVAVQPSPMHISEEPAKGIMTDVMLELGALSRPHCRDGSA